MKKPFYPLLLPLFFAVHGFLRFFNPYLATAAITVALVYTGISVALVGLFYLLYRDIFKASLAAFCLLAFNFLFGSVHDFLKAHLHFSIIARYSFMIPFSFLCLGLIIIFLYRTQQSLIRLTKFLNLLLLIILLIDIGALIFQGINYRPVTVDHIPFTTADKQATPDVYLIIADEYPGEKTLNEVFGYSNQPFYDTLNKRGFYIIQNSFSNYNHTYYSMASLLNMSYLNGLEQDSTNHRDMLSCAKLVNESQVGQFFKSQRYTIHNISFFDFAGLPNTIQNPFYKGKGKLITAQTFYDRVQKDLGLSLWESPVRDHNNQVEHLLQSTISYSSPKFVYAHFNLPHHPYLMDSTGKLMPLSAWQDEDKFNHPHFIQYLKYSNKLLTQVIDTILLKSKTPPVILLLGDHGFRQFREERYNKYWFINLNAIYLPDHHYGPFYNNLSNVNLFRVLLNGEFNQRIPYIKDSSHFIWER